MGGRKKLRVGPVIYYIGRSLIAVGPFHFHPFSVSNRSKIGNFTQQNLLHK